LRESPVISSSWRDEVRAYWGRQQCLGKAVSKFAAARASAQRFKEGERVRYVGPSAGNLHSHFTGMIVRGRGPYGASIHPDELCNSVFVDWDRAAARPVFVAQLEHETANTFRDADEASRCVK
jgi:hypothetical protein